MKKTILSFLAVLTLVFGTSAQIPTINLVGQYDFTNGTLTDNISGADFTKTGIASTTITDRFGNISGAISLNGDDLTRSDIDFNTSTSTPFLTQTISFWIKTATNDANTRIIYNDNDQVTTVDATFSGLRVYLENGQITAGLRDNQYLGNYITHSTIVSDNNWHHITVQAYVTSLSGTQRIKAYVFVDAVKEGGTTLVSNAMLSDAPDHFGNISFSRLKGASVASNDKYEDGIDEVLFYTRILTDTEVSSITTNGFCTVNIPDPNFKAYLLGNGSINNNGDAEIQCSEAAAFTGWIYCSNLSISDLTGIEAFTNIIGLLCNENQLTSLNLSSNTMLETVQCHTNQLTALDVPNSINQLTCHTNQLTSLDLSSTASLTGLYCANNQLTYLNLANTNNANMIATLDPGLHALNNPNLTCIQIDAGYTPNGTDWVVDATVSYSTNCSSVLVNSITVQGQGGVSTITTQGGSLQMEASVLPANADDMTYTWSVINGSGTANIDANGLLTAITDGTVTVIANANDASGIVGTLTITISNQSVGLNEFDPKNISIYPNPVPNELFVDITGGQINQLEIIDYAGRVLKTISDKQVKSIDVSNLTQGIYILKVSTENGISTQQFIKK